jgi:hypothetical protein
MANRAIEFVENWVSENIKAEGRPAEGDNSRAQALAVQCLNAARNEGISDIEIKDAFDDLAAFIGGEIEEAKDREDGTSDEDDDEDEEEEADGTS